MKADVIWIVPVIWVTFAFIPQAVEGAATVRGVGRAAVRRDVLVSVATGLRDPCLRGESCAPAREGESAGIHGRNRREVEPWR